MRVEDNEKSGNVWPWLGAIAAAAALLWFGKNEPPANAPTATPRPTPATAPLSTSPAAATSPPNAPSPNGGARPFAVAQDERVAFPIITNPSPEATDEEKSRWVGAAVCGECHAENWKSALHSAHYNTSRFASGDSLLGDYHAPGNRMGTGDPALSFEMLEDAGRFFQSAVQNGRESHRATIDLILGSGKMAQTYATWVKDALFELPVTYYTTARSWVYSPGYMDGQAFFARPVNSGCLDCHTTGYIPESEGEKNHRFKSRHIVPGVTCERCHGEGAQHVQHHRTHPTDKQAKHILDPRKLPAAKRDMLCSQCHGGVNTEDGGTDKVGAHSNNQLQRLSLSACFTRSESLHCTDCHNPHRKERGDNKLFARRCQTCHEIDDCNAVTPDRREHFADNCAQCHMPRQQMVDIDFRTTTGQVVSGFTGGDGVNIPEIVDHHIRVVRSDKTAPPSPDR